MRHFLSYASISKTCLYKNFSFWNYATPHFSPNFVLNLSQTHQPQPLNSLKTLAFFAFYQTPAVTNNIKLINYNSPPISLSYLSPSNPYQSPYSTLPATVCLHAHYTQLQPQFHIQSLSPFDPHCNLLHGQH